MSKPNQKQVEKVQTAKKQETKETPKAVQVVPALNQTTGAPRKMQGTEYTPEELAAKAKAEAEAAVAKAVSDANQKPPKEKARKFELVTYSNAEVPGIGTGILGPEGATFRKGTILHDLFLLWLRKPQESLTIAQQVEELHKLHPDHPKESLETSVRVKISRTPVKRGFKLGRDDKGRYSIWTEGRSTTRTLTPEQEAKKAEALKAKAEKQAAKEVAKAEKAKLKAEAAEKAKVAKAAAEAVLAAAKRDAEAAKAKAVAEAAAKAPAPAK